MPMLDLFWSMLVFFAFVCWIVLVVRVFADIFGRADLSGLGKVLWIMVVFAIPLIGVLIYILVRGRREPVPYNYAYQTVAP